MTARATPRPAPSSPPRFPARPRRARSRLVDGCQRPSRDSGQAVLVTVVVLLVMVVLVVLIARTGSVLDDRARAVTAADAAALAGAVEGEAGAAELASANGAVLERFERHGVEVVVEVRIGPVRARARAEVRPIFEATGTIP